MIKVKKKNISELSRKLNSAQAKSDYSQTQIATALGGTRALISQWLNGRVPPQWVRLILLCKLLEVDIQHLSDELLKGVDVNAFRKKTLKK